MQHLTKDKCPECGAETKAITQKEQHCNGHWNEERKYKCGLTLHFSPNFMREVTSEQCRNGASYKEFQKKRQEAFNRLVKVIDSLDVDDKYKTRLRTDIHYANPQF